MRRWLLVISLCLFAGVVHASSGGAQVPLPELEKARIDAAAKTFGLYETQYKAGLASAEVVYQWSRRWCEAEGCSAAPSLEAHYKRMKALETTVATKVQAGMANAGDKAAAEYYRIEAELWVRRGKGP